MRNDGSRSQRSTMEIRERNQVDTESLLQEEPAPAPAIQPQEIQRDLSQSQPKQYEPQGESHVSNADNFSQNQPSEVDIPPPAQQATNEFLPTIGQQTQQVDAPADYYPRYDDDIFARTNFSPHKGKIIDNTKFPDERHSPEKPRDPTAVYEQDAKNQLIAIEKRIDHKEEKVEVLKEEKAMLDDLIDQEEAKRLESKLRRDYRKRIDHYHINLTDNKFYDEKVLRVAKTRNKAGTIKEEAARVENEKVAETLHIKEKKAKYKAELDKLAMENKRAKEKHRKTHYEAER